MGMRKQRSDFRIDGGLEVVGNSTFKGNVNIEGSMVFEDTLAASSNATVAGTLGVTKTITASSKATVTKTLTASSGFLGTANSSFSGTLKVDNTLTASSGLLGTANSSFSGTLKVDNTLTASSGFLGTANSSFSGTLKVTKTLTASSGVAVPVESATTAALTLRPYGISTIDAGTTGSRSWTLGTPVAGYRKTISLIAAASTLSPRNVLVATGIAILTTGSTTANKIRMFKEGDSVTLDGISATLWAMTGKTGVVLTSNSTTTT